MKKLTDYKTILWDFDGVLMDSMPVRDLGFKSVLENYPAEQVDELMRFHRQNGGLSRYVKFRYFFENIRGETISESEVLVLASRFSEIMLQLLLNPGLLISDSLEFVKKYHRHINMHVISGSDGNELRKICDGLGIASYFQSIQGSPTPKKELVKSYFLNHPNTENDTLFIGDSINDYEAAMTAPIAFSGYNNPSLEDISNGSYIHSFSQY